MTSNIFDDLKNIKNIGLDGEGSNEANEEIDFKDKSKHQNIQVRDICLESIKKDIENKTIVRTRLMWFTIFFLSIITLASFYIILFTDESNTLKCIIASEILVSVISIVTLFVKYAFSENISIKLLEIFKETKIHDDEY